MTDTYEQLGNILSWGGCREMRTLYIGDGNINWYHIIGNWLSIIYPIYKIYGLCAPFPLLEFNLAIIIIHIGEITCLHVFFIVHYLQ